LPEFALENRGHLIQRQMMRTLVLTPGVSHLLIHNTEGTRADLLSRASDKLFYHLTGCTRWLLD